MSSTTQHHQAAIGPPNDQWLYSSLTGFDLTRSHHPPTSSTTASSPSTESSITLATTTLPITLSPSRTALVIIDMQNYFLSPFFGRPTHLPDSPTQLTPGHAALQQLVTHAIPAARKAGIRVLWVNWGLSERDLAEMPAGVRRAFGFEVEVVTSAGVSGEGGKEVVAVDKLGSVRGGSGEGSWEGKKVMCGLGSDCGVLRDEKTGKTVAAGRMLVRDQWNTALCPPLDRLFEEGRELEVRPDVWLHKNRMSAMWESETNMARYLKESGITTLLFGGVNTDQCVLGTMADSFSRGYDCVLLSDGCGTTSPAPHSQASVEYNAARTYGFLTSCKTFHEGVTSSLASKTAS